MQTTINQNGKKVTITLTPEQVAQIKKETTNYTDIKTVEDAFEFLGIDYAKWLEARKHLDDDEIAYGMLRIWTKAINGGKWINYKNVNENKTYPYFNSLGSSAGFSYIDYYCDLSHSVVGSRLCFIDPENNGERAKYSGKQILEVYNRFINASEE